jgi:hypothetical protein
MRRLPLRHNLVSVLMMAHCTASVKLTVAALRRLTTGCGTRPSATALSRKDTSLSC